MTILVLLFSLLLHVHPVGPEPSRIGVHVCHPSTVTTQSVRRTL